MFPKKIHSLTQVSDSACFLPYRSILQIFVHILKGEKIINEAIAKEKEEQLKNPTARAPAGSSGLHGAHSIPASASGSQGPAADESARLAVLLASMSEGMDAEIERALQEPTPQPRNPSDQSMAAARAGDRMAANAAAALAANGSSQVRFIYGTIYIFYVNFLASPL